MKYTFNELSFWKKHKLVIWIMIGVIAVVLGITLYFVLRPSPTPSVTTPVINNFRTTPVVSNDPVSLSTLIDCTLNVKNILTGVNTAFGKYNFIEGADVHMIKVNNWYYLTTTNILNPEDFYQADHCENPIDGTCRSGKKMAVPLYYSNDLVNWTYRPVPISVNGQNNVLISNDNGVYTIGGGQDSQGNNFESQYFFNIWGPQIAKVTTDDPPTFMLTFTASISEGEYTGDQCGTNFECKTNQYTIFTMSSKESLENQDTDPGGIFRFAKNPWEPMLVVNSTGNYTPETCPGSIPKSNMPYAPVSDLTRNKNTMRLDSHFWKDPRSNKNWFVYSWFGGSMSNSNSEESMAITQMGDTDPFKTHSSCETYYISSKRESSKLQNALINVCKYTDCAFVNNFGMSQGPAGVSNSGNDIHTVLEGGSMCRIGDWVYLFFSTSAWNSPGYNVSYIAINDPKGENIYMFDDGTEFSDGQKIAGIFLPPGKVGDDLYTFGHGTPFQGLTDGEWFFVAHSTNYTKGWFRFPSIFRIDVDPNTGRIKQPYSKCSYNNE